MINVTGIIYLIFVLPEPKKQPKKEIEGLDNPAFEKTKGDQIDAHHQATNGRQTLDMDEAEKKPKHCLLDFFNPIVAVECVRLLVRKRQFNARRLVLLLLFLYFVVQAASGKSCPLPRNHCIPFTL